jgi:ABC-2 type transport system permease protein
MNGNLFRQYVRSEWKLLLLYAVALFILHFWFVFMYPLFGGTEELVQLVRRLPRVFRTMMGGELANAFTLNGVASFAYIHPVVTAFVALFLIGFPTKAITLQVERGTFDFLLSRPISRTSFYMTTLAFFVAGVIVLLAFGFGGTATGGWVVHVPGEHLQLGQFLKAHVNAFALCLAVGGMTFVIAAALSSRGTAIGLPMAILVLFYFLFFLSEYWSPARAFGPLSFFHYFRPQKVVLVAGHPVWRDVAVLAGVAAALFAIGGFVFARRDIRVVA